MTHEPSTKISICIVGDAFADIFCFLNKPTSHSKKGEVVPMGGCVLVDQPLQTMPGGSGINTSTHLCSLLQDFVDKKSLDGLISSNWDIQLQTVLNPKDEHGTLLLDHAKKYNLPIINCHPDYCFNDSQNQENQNKTSPNHSSTPHVIVIVSPGERSFIAHLGCIAHFQAHQIDTQKLINSHDDVGIYPNNQSHHLHIHIAGYYNIQGFWNNALKQELKRVKTERSKLGPSYTTTISLTPQYDSLQEWDGGILSLLEYIDFLILSEDEAEGITTIKKKEWRKMAEHFYAYSPNTVAIVTLGAEGVIALSNGEVIHEEKSNVVDHVVDATGAGDAFAAGFVFGFLKGQYEENYDDKRSNIDNIKKGMRWGCATGAACVKVAGASVPASKYEIEHFLCIK